jgi:hypothetical protein
LIITERFLYFLISTERSLAIDPHREVLINIDESDEETIRKLRGYAANKLRDAVVSFAEAGSKREPFAAVQQLDFSGFTTTVDTRTNATKDLRNNADSLRDPFTTDPHMEVPHY